MEALLDLHPDDRERHAEELRRFLSSRGRARGRIPHPSRRRRLPLGARAHYCMRDAEGAPLRIAGSVSDIDDRKRVEAALRESEERYALA